MAEFLERHHEVIHLVTTASPFLNVLQFPARNRLLPQHFHLPEKQIFPSRHNYSYPGEISGMAQLMDVFVEIVIVLLPVYCLQLYIYRYYLASEHYKDFIPKYTKVPEIDLSAKIYTNLSFNISHVDS